MTSNSINHAHRLTSTVPCFHGGAFFDAIGDEFNALERRHAIINADVLDAWFPPSPKVVAALRDNLPWLLRTSPPTHAEGLARVIARVRGVKPLLLGKRVSRFISSCRYGLIPEATSESVTRTSLRVSFRQSHPRRIAVSPSRRVGLVGRSAAPRSGVFSRRLTATSGCTAALLDLTRRDVSVAV